MHGDGLPVQRCRLILPLAQRVNGRLVQQGRAGYHVHRGYVACRINQRVDAHVAGYVDPSAKFAPREFSPPASSPLFTSSAGSISPFACTLAERRTLGLARRIWPREGLLISGSTASSVSADFVSPLLRSLLEPDFGMRSVMAVACTLPWAGEETGAGASDIALAEFAFLPVEGASGVASGVNEGVTSAAEFADGAVGSEAER